MERKIGEIFEYNGEWYQCIEGFYCADCAFKNDDCEDRERITLKEKMTKEETTGLCISELRKDGKSVIFKKLEKVGEPYPKYAPTGRVIYFQSYKCYRKPVYNGDFIYWSDDITISIEIKQTKEDMEEKMKPFDLEAAKSGKPVCTRNGRKARIICFDLKNGNYPIVAAIGNDCSEALFNYTIKGEIIPGVKSEKDLMMLPKKKEGWINIYLERDAGSHRKGGWIYDNEEEAVKVAKTYGSEYIGTIKINWEE